MSENEEGEPIEINPRYANKVRGIFRSCIVQALNDWFNVDDTICPVLYAGQPPIQTAKRYVIFHKISSTQIGQGRKIFEDKNSPSGLVEIENWIEEVTFQVNVRTKELASDGEDAITAHDIADGLRAWFNSHQGIGFMREKSVAALKVTQIRELVNTDESDLYQNTASFDIALHIGQAHTRNVDEVYARLVDVIGV